MSDKDKNPFRVPMELWKERKMLLTPPDPLPKQDVYRENDREPSPQRSKNVLGDRLMGTERGNQGTTRK